MNANDQDAGDGESTIGLRPARRVDFTRMDLEAAALPSSPTPTPENVTIRSTRQAKAQVARQALGTLQAAIQAEDWNSAQGSAELIAQMARWLKLSDESIEQNS